ncbi:MAG: ABC transporter substrate-binding protein [Actinomycetota bacterium]
MLRRRGALPAWGISLALVLSACSGGGGDAKPVPGGTLRVNVRDLGSLDPAATTGRGGLLAIGQLFDSLTTIDPKTGETIPAAAASWTTSANGLAWDFTLADATFQDGTPVTAASFKAAFDRIARKATGSDVAFQLEAVQGFNAAKIAGTAQGLSGVQVVSPKVLRVALDRPFAELGEFLAHPALAPLPVSMLNHPQALQNQPIGNGAFKMAAPRAGDRVVLERNDTHAGGTAYLDRLEIRLVGDPDQSWRDFLGNRAEVSEVPTNALSNRARAGTGGFSPFWAALYYGPNIKNPKYQNPRVREAISLAINREQIAETVYGGTKEPASGLIPRGVRGYARDACPNCKRDVERARSLIQAAFGGKPPEMIIDHLNASPPREVAQAIAGDLESIGLRVALREHSSTDYLNLLERGQHEIAEYGWLSEVPSPDGFLAQQLRTGSANNHTGFSDRIFDSLIDQARSAKTDEAALDGYRKAEQRALEFLPLIPIVFYRNHIGVAERVHGLQVDGAGLFDAAGVWIERG